jgi:hypothetical protein
MRLELELLECRLLWEAERSETRDDKEMLVLLIYTADIYFNFDTYFQLLQASFD